jgi:hypothetical protein
MGPTATVERAIDNLKSVRDAGGVTCHQANAPGWRRTTEGVHASDVNEPGVFLAGPSVGA